MLVVGNDRGGTDEDIDDLCPQCREELGVMDLLGFGQYIACAVVHIICELQRS